MKLGLSQHLGENHVEWLYGTLKQNQTVNNAVNISDKQTLLKFLR